ncbi:M16 family metallopeptidase [Kocuria palustris]|uniref:M16 family metallopeptidase n=1 Tax=Kocuria palustris TaxID=71999 RepID=UPI00246933CF|nr:pitrilysin family protein [Kocuria palustris]MDH5151827.1 pitrilysin family protein [Kocuria palustris]
MSYALELRPQDPARTHSPELVWSGDGGAAVRRTVLPNGVRILTESMPGLLSASVGFWVGVGSRDEQRGHLGSTHFLEHLLFKGTARRSALQIAEAFDEVGGESNAATAKESTCYYARVLSEDLPMAIDVLADMVTAPLLETDELERERGVILEELAMDQDDPTDVAFEHFVEHVLHGNPLSRPIGGTPEEIIGVARQRVLEHWQEHYRPENLVVTAAGGLDHDRVVEEVRERLARAGWDPEAPGRPRARRSGQPDGLAQLSPEWGRHLLHRPVEQSNVVIGRPGLVTGDERRYVMTVLNAALGGGMSSRLFQEIREKRGLAYSTFSFSGSYSDAGYFGMYAGCAPARTDEVLELMQAQLQELAADGPGERELAKVVGQLAGGTVMALEDSGSRMSRLGSAELGIGEFVDLEETMNRVRSVTAQDVQRLAAELAEGPAVVQVVQPPDGQ